MDETLKSCLLMEAVKETLGKKPKPKPKKSMKESQKKTKTKPKESEVKTEDLKGAGNNLVKQAQKAKKGYNMLSDALAGVHQALRDKDVYSSQYSQQAKELEKMIEYLNSAKISKAFQDAIDLGIVLGEEFKNI